MLQYRQGDIAAFDELYRRYRDRLHRFVLRLAHDRAEAEEVSQDVWLALIARRDAYRPRARFVTFLFTIAHRRVVDRLRRRRPWAALSLVEKTAACEQGTPGQLLEAADLGRRLLAALEALPWPQREAFLLQAEGGLSLAEIGQATGAGRETVKSRLRYAASRLRAVVEADR